MAQTTSNVVVSPTNALPNQERASLSPQCEEARPLKQRDRKQRDRATLDASWPALRPRLVRQAARLIAAQEADDIVQTAYLRAATLIERHKSPIGTDGLHRWLRAIVTNICRAYRKQATQHDEWLLPPNALAEVVNAYTDTAAQHQDEPITLGEIEPHFQIQSLKRRRREVWELWRKGYTQAQIAAALGLTQQAISYQVGLIIDQLRAIAGDLITRADGYPSTAAMFNAHARVTIYRRPLRRGAFRGNQKIKRLR